MITIQNFNENNRSKIIGNSTYKICNTDETAATGHWYIHELYTTDDGAFATSRDFHSKNLQAVIDKFNGITEEREICSLAFL